MDERSLKRLLITLAVAIGIILLAKSMLTRTYTNLNKAAAAKRQAAVQQQAPSTPPVTAPPAALPEPVAASGISASEPPASAVAEGNAR